MASSYPKWNDNEIDLLREIAQNSAALADAGGGGVSSIIAGLGISISPITGLGDVTISIAPGGGVTSAAGTAGNVLVNGATAAASGAVTLSLPTTLTSVNAITAAAAANLTLNAGSGNQNIVLVPSGTGLVSIAQSYTGTVSHYSSQVQLTHTASGASSGSIAALSAISNIAGAQATTGDSGLQGNLISTNTNTGTSGEAVLAHISASGTGVKFNYLAGFRTSLDMTLDSVVEGDVYGLYVPQLDVTQTLGVGKVNGGVYGVKINDLYDATTKPNAFGFYQAGANMGNVLMGKLGVGTATLTTGQLSAVGATTTTAAFSNVYNVLTSTLGSSNGNRLSTDFANHALAGTLAATNASAYHAQFDLSNTATGNDVAGVRAIVNVSGTGNANNVAGLVVSINHNGTANINGDVYGVRVLSVARNSSGNLAGGVFGLHVGTISGTGISSPYSLYTSDASAPAYISGNLLIGSTTTTGLTGTGGLRVANTTESTSAGAGSAIILGGLFATKALVNGGIRVVSTDTISGAGAISVTKDTTKFTSTGPAQALTLADGVDGQIKCIIHDVDGGSGILTPTTKTGYTTIAFTNAGDSATLEFVTTRGWIIIGLFGAVAA